MDLMMKNQMFHNMNGIYGSDEMNITFVLKH